VINKPKEKIQPPEKSKREYSQAKTDELSRPKTAVVKKTSMMDIVPEKKQPVKTVSKPIAEKKKPAVVAKTVVVPEKKKSVALSKDSVKTQQPIKQPPKMESPEKIVTKQEPTSA
jgi:hypothetical protein